VSLSHIKVAALENRVLVAMNRPRLAQVFKVKADELADTLLARFPAQLAIPIATLRAVPAGTMIQSYGDNVRSRYGDHIAEHDESFFLTAHDGDFDHPMVLLLRALWAKLGDGDKEAVWAFLDVFQRLSKAYESAAGPSTG
jgi:hypothetical protein